MVAAVVRNLGVGCVAFSAMLSVHAQEVSPAWQSECEAKLPHTEILVEVVESPVVFDSTNSLAQVTARSPTHLHGTSTTLGLTVARTQMSSSVGGTTLTRSSEALACARPLIKVTLTLASHVVYIAKEFRVGSCAYAHIAKHEMRHVLVNRAVLRQTAASLQAELQASFGNRVFYGTLAQVSAGLTDHIQNEWTPWVLARMNRAEAAHGQIDTRAEYARNQVACQGEIARIAGR